MFANVLQRHETSKQNISGNKYYPYTQDSLQIQLFGENIAIVDRYPKKTPEIMRRVYVKAIESAKEKIQIINPYFTPTSSIKKAIRKAVERGVKVEIMIPGKSDIPFTPDAAMYIANRLRKKGADIYIFNGGFHHSKIMMIDNTFYISKVQEDLTITLEGLQKNRYVINFVFFRI